MRIREIVAALATGTVRLGDREVQARALRAGETDLMARLWPRPVPRKTRTAPNKGSLSQVPDEDDPEFRAELAAAIRRSQCVQVAAACGLETESGAAWGDGQTPEALRKFGEEVTAEMTAALTSTQIDRAFLAVRDLIDEGRAREAVLVEIPADAAAPEAYKLPERYGVPDGGQFLRVCERYKIDPFVAAGVEHDHPGMWALLRAQEAVRLREDAGVDAAPG